MTDLTIDYTPELVEKVAIAIHQCHFHPVDWGSKEWRGIFDRERTLYDAMAKHAIDAMRSCEYTEVKDDNVAN